MSHPWVGRWVGLMKQSQVWMFGNWRRSAYMAAELESLLCQAGWEADNWVFERGYRDSPMELEMTGVMSLAVLRICALRIWNTSPGPWAVAIVCWEDEDIFPTEREANPVATCAAPSPAWSWFQSDLRLGSHFCHQDIPPPNPEGSLALLAWFLGRIAVQRNTLIVMNHNPK
jgi:hypothetical protein